MIKQLGWVLVVASLLLWRIDHTWAALFPKEEAYQAGEPVMMMAVGKGGFGSKVETSLLQGALEAYRASDQETADTVTPLLKIAAASGKRASLFVNGHNILTLRNQNRLALIKKRLHGLLTTSQSLKILPLLLKGDRYFVVANGQPLVEVDRKEAKLRGVSRWRLTCLWVNRLRKSLQKLPFSYRDFAGNYSQHGQASWYGGRFIGRATSSGDRYGGVHLTAAHRTLPFGTRVLVTRLDTGKHVMVRINDRGPFIRGRIIDLSARAARELGMLSSGVAPVRIDVMAASHTEL